MFLQTLITEKINNNPGYVDSCAQRIFERTKLKIKEDTVAYNTPIQNYGKKNLTDVSYSKGMLFFYLIYKRIGEKSFLQLMNQFISKYKNSGATIRQFSEFMKSNHKTELGPIVNDWIVTNHSSKQIMSSKTLKSLLQLQHF